MKSSALSGLTCLWLTLHWIQGVTSDLDVSFQASGRRNYGSTGVFLFQGLITELASCGWDHLIIINKKEQNKELESELLTSLVRNSVVFTVYQIDKEDFASVFYREYVDNKRNYFVLISDNNFEFLWEVNSLFHNFSRKYMAALPQRSSWLLLHDRRLGSAPEWMRQSCVLDNVAVADVQVAQSCSVSTLMWRPARRREWELVDLTRGTGRCSVFPNKRNGFNGRPLRFAVVGMTYGVMISNNSLGQPEYSGFFIDTALELMKRMNFTFTYEPRGDTIEKFEDVVSTAQADMGLVYYSPNAAVEKGMGVTYPVVFDTVVAAYVYNSSMGVSYFSSLQQSSTTLVVAIVFSAFIFVVVLYQVMLHLYARIRQGNNVSPSSSRDEHSPRGLSLSRSPLSCCNEKMCKAERKASFQIAKRLAFINLLNLKPRNTIPKSRDAKQNSPRMRHPILFKLLESCRYAHQHFPNLHILGFYGSFLNQSSLVRPRAMSLRILIFSWSIFVLLFDSLIVGTMTAGFVKPLTSPPFTSLAEALQSTQVEVGTFWETEIHGRSKHWTVSGQRWKGSLRQFPFTFDNSSSDFRNFMEKPSTKPKVFVYYKSLLSYFKKSTNFKNLYMTSDHYQSYFMGFVLPANSDLEQMISQSIVRLHESGFMLELSRRYVQPNDSTLSSGEDNSQASVTTVSYYIEFFGFIAILLFTTFFVLAVEHLVHMVILYFEQ